MRSSEDSEEYRQTAVLHALLCGEQQARTDKSMQMCGAKKHYQITDTTYSCRPLLPAKCVRAEWEYLNTSFQLAMKVRMAGVLQNYDNLLRELKLVNLCTYVD